VFRRFLERTEALLCVVGRRPKDGDLDGAVRVDDVNAHSFVVVVGSVRRHDERDAKLDRTRRSDIVVIQRLSGVQWIFDDNAKRPCTSFISHLLHSRDLANTTVK